MSTTTMPRAHASRPRNRGFTLIELLVVIAIIAILAAILFPVFARARENARRAACMSNHKQMGLGIMQYTQDYDEKYPSAYYYKNGASGSGGYVHWSGAIQPYVKSTQLFTCPSHAQPLIATNGSEYRGMVRGVGTRQNDGKGLDAQAPKLSYTANELLLPRKRKDSDPSNTVSLSAVQEVASVIMLAELTDVPEAINDTSVASGTNNKSHRPTNGIANSGGGVYDGENASIRTAASFTALTPQQAIDAIKAAKAARSGAGQHHIAYISPDRHLDGAVYTFADGHAKWYRLENTLNPDAFLWGKSNYSAGGQPILKPGSDQPVG